MRCGHEQTIEVLRAEIARLQSERADLLRTLRMAFHMLPGAADPEKCAAIMQALRYHDEERV